MKFGLGLLDVEGPAAALADGRLGDQADADKEEPDQLVCPEGVGADDAPNRPWALVRGRGPLGRGISGWPGLTHD